MSKNSEENIYKQLKEIEKKKENLVNKKNKLSEILQSRINFIVTILILIGILNFYSINVLSDRLNSKMITYFANIIISIIGFFIFYRFINYKIYSSKKFQFFLFLFGLISFIIVGFLNIPMFPRVNGAKGWVDIFGRRFQITEIYKIAFVIIVAEIFSRNEKREEGVNYKIKFLSVFIKCAVFFIVFVFSLNDLGTFLHYIMIAAFIIFMTELSDKWIIAIISLLGSIGFLGSFYLYNFSIGYKADRIVSYINGLINLKYDNGTGYQVFQSLIGFGSGGIIGKGYGNGIQKYSYLPEIDTDFAIVTFAEEFGMIGMIVLLLLYFLLFYNIMKISKLSKDYFSKYLIIGIAGYILTQMLINISVAIGLLPVFGIPLPFISYGGSSLLTIMISLGIVSQINKKNNKL